MFKILDRYLIREILPPLVLSLVVLTFVLEIPPILREGEALIARGALLEAPPTAALSSGLR